MIERRQSNYLTPTQVARDLLCSAALIRNLFHQGELTGIKVGAAIRIHRHSVAAYIARQSRPSKTKAEVA